MMLPIRLGVFALLLFFLSCGFAFAQPTIPAGQTFTVAENSPVLTAVGTVTGTLSPSGVALTGWTITAGNINIDADANSAFAIGALTGIITVADAGDLNRETNASIVLTITVQDANGTSAGQAVTINLNDVNEFTPVVTAAQTRSISETLANGSNVGGVLLATDGDATATLQSWTISTNSNADGDGNNAFAIDGTSGQLTVNDVDDLNRELNSTLNIQVTVSDGTNTAAATQVDITLNDVNDVAPVVTAGQSRAVNENAAATTVIGAVLVATDGDATATVYSGWAITTNANPDGDGNNAVAIDPSTGQLTVNDAGDFDREAGASFNIQVTVSDGTNTSIAETITININDVNDVAPVIGAASRSVDENSAMGSNVGAVITATDNDATATTFSSWAITVNANPDADANNAFAIDANTGQITVNDAGDLNFEANTSFNIQVTVSDGVNTSAAQTITINLNDLDEVSPTVTINQNGGADPRNTSPISFSVVFSEAIDPSTFTDSDITLGGTATGLSVAGRTTGDNITWNVTIAATGSGTVIPSLAAGVVTDLAGNASTISTSTDNSVTFDNTPPSFSGVAPITNAFVRNTQVSYSLSEAAASGSITWTEVGGPLDPGSPHVQALTGTELNAGAHNTITLTNNPTLVNDAVYNVTFNAADALGNVATTVTSNTVTFDNVAPIISPNELSFASNGVLAETITFTLSEELNIAAGPVTGFTVSAGAIASAIYSGKGTTNTITLTSAANAQWTSATTVSYTPGTVTDLAGNNLASFATKAVTENLVTLGPGAIAFTGYNSQSGSNNDEDFTFVLLQDLAAGTRIKFTDNGWDGTALTTDEGTITWEASVLLYAGTEVRIFDNGNNAAGAITCSAGVLVSPPNEISLTDAGDQLLAYQGSSTSPTFIAGIHVSDAGGEDGTTLWNTNSEANGNNSRSSLPSTLTNGTHAVSFSPSRNHNAKYNGTTTGTVAALRTAINTYTNWVDQNDVFYTLTFGNNFTIPPDITGLSPAHNSFVSATLPNLTITFNDNVVAGTSTGNDITLRLDNGTFVQSWNVGTAAVSIAGNVVTVNTSSLALANGQVYEIDIASRAFINADQNGNTPLVGDTNWKFTSDGVAPTVTSVNRQSPSTTPTNAASVTFRVTFSEAMASASVSAGDFTVTQTGLTTGLVSINPISTTVWDVTVATIAGNGNIQLDVATPTATVTDIAGNALTTSFTTGQSYTIDQQRPTVTSIVRKTPLAQLTNATSVVYTVTFSEAVNNVVASATDFTVTTVSGTATGTVSNVTSSSGTSIDVTINTITGNGELRLDVPATATITDNSTNALNVGFTTGETYVVDQTRPTVLSSNRLNTTPTNATSVNYRVTFSEGVQNVSAADFTPVVVSGAITFNTPVVTPVAANIYDVQVPNVAGDGVLRLDIDASTATIDDLATNALNTTFNTGQTYTIDQTRPTIQSIVIDNSPVVLAGFGSTNGTLASTLEYTITFNEPVTGFDLSDLSLTSLPTIVPDPFNFPVVSANMVSVTGGSTVYTLTVNVTGGTGRLRPDLFANGTIVDAAGNANNTSFNAGNVFTLIMDQPTAQSDASSFSATPINTTRIDLNWNNPAFGFDWPTHYLIRVTGPDVNDAPGVYPAIADGDYYLNDFDFSDGKGAVNLDVYWTGQNYYSFTTLLSGKDYNFEIIPYNLSPNTTSDNVNYNPSAIATTSATTPAAAASTLITYSNAPATISSLSTAYTAAEHFKFDIDDDGGTDAADNSKLRFTQVTISRGEPIANWPIWSWANVIEEAQLTDDEGNTITHTSITAGAIVFTTPTTDNAIGEVDDNETKTYTLKIRLKNPMLGTAPTLIDNKRFIFTVSAGSFAYVGGSSTLAGTQSASSDPTAAGTNNRVDVVATALNYTVQPQANPLVLTSLSPSPVIRAQDANGNTDLNYTLPVTVSNTAGITMTGLNAAPANSLTPVAGVITFPAAFSYGDDGNGTLTVTDGVLSTGPSNAITVSYSTTSTITPGSYPVDPSFPATATGLYNVFAFNFNVNDDNNVVVGTDGAPSLISQIVITAGTGNTVANWADAIQGAILYSGGSPYPLGTISGNTITFSNLDQVLGGYTPGFIADNGSKNFELYIWMKTSMTGTAKTTIDNKNFVFEVLPANISYNTVSSKIGASENENSGALNNKVLVTASKIVFDVQPAAELLVNKDIVQQLPKPVIHALDPNNNRDLDYVTPIAITNAGGLDMTVGGVASTTVNINADGTAPSAGGVFTFPDNFQFEEIGNGTLTATAAGIASPGNIVNSTAVLVRVAKSSTITAGGDAEPATISSLATSTPGTQVFDFTINDDAGAENDGNPTIVTTLTVIAGGGDEISALSTNGWADAIASARLTDCADPSLPGCTSIVAAANITSSYLVFNLPIALGTIADNTSKTYKLLITLKPAMSGTMPSLIDGKKFEFEVVQGNVATDPANSAIVLNEVENSGAANVVTVVATDLNFSLLDATDNFKVPYADANFPTNGSINSPFLPQGLGIEASDANGNRDLGFTGTITAFSVENGLTVINAPIITPAVPLVFANGTYKMPDNFQYTSGDNQLGKLTVTAGGVTGVSPDITIISSFESWITTANNYTTYTAPTTIDYAYYQATDIQNDANSLELIKLALSDGDADLKDGKALATNTDVDGANTVLTSLTLRVTNYESIRKIAIYNAAGTEIQELSSTDFNTVVGNAASITFTGLNITAPDNDHVLFSIRASFFNDAARIQDNEVITLKLQSAVLGGGSRFFDDPSRGLGAYILGNRPANVTVNTPQVEVTATKFDFDTQHARPDFYAGIDEPVTSGSLVAVDQNSLVDIDFNATATISAATAGVSYSSQNFSNGAIALTGLRYTSAGAGKISVSANSGAITSNMSNTVGGLANVSITGAAINVHHVTAAGNTSGVVQTTNLKGGSTNVAIFGVTFHSQYNAGGHPKLSSFKINFDNPYKTSTTTIFKNIRIYKSTGGTYAGSTSVTISDPGTTISESNTPSVPATAKNLITVTFPVGSEPALASDLTFYLVVDIDASANISTPKLTPALIDNGYSTPTDNHIVTTRGSATANVIGNQYSFASTRPPALVRSFPANGQLNVDPMQDTISLVFDVGVWSLDSVVQLYDRYSNTHIATLKAKNGRFAGQQNPNTQAVTDTLTFQIPASVLPLKPDSVYYITVAKGTHNANTDKGTGIADDGLNLYGGISYNGTVYFKVSGTTPPAMIGTKDADYYLTTKGGAINARFNKLGRAYFMVVNANDTKPTNAQIKSTGTGYTGTEVARGIIDIKKISDLQFGTFNATLTAGATYDVWMYAENDALPTPFANPQPFGSAAEGFAVGGSNPTFKIEIPAATAGIYVNNPLYQVCANSNVLLSDPIIIQEGSNGQFTHAARQEFNILLPAGFQFDMTNLPNITLTGPDFSTAVPGNLGQLQASYLNNTLLKVSFINTNSGGIDKIVITGMKVTATSVDLSGQIKRFGGNAILPALADESVLARITSQPSDPLLFDNSYNIYNNFKQLPIAINEVVTYIPDNFGDTLSTSQAQRSVRLLPRIPKGDYGPTSFSGAGVTNDLLSLTGVDLGVAFDITMTHTDMNGCVSTKAEQYQIYDHTKGIEILGTKACAPNENFPAAAPSLLSSETVTYNGLSQYSLISLSAKIPKGVKAGTQIIYGPDWQELVDSIPRLQKNVAPAGFANYKWDYSWIVNAASLSGNVLPDPYLGFAEIEQGRTYYKGGSLGIVEFTGKYRSNADNSVFIPFRQEVEVFLPAKPIVISTNGTKTPVPIYCENAAPFTLTGYPQASAGKSKAFFVLSDSANNTLIYDARSMTVLPQGFTDNGNSNGSAILDPSKIKNAYRTIKVDYYYQDDNSPCEGRGTMYLRVTPNPVADFNFSTYTCAGSPIEFTSGASLPAGFRVDSVAWDFGDQNALAELNVSKDPVTDHVFSVNGNYNVAYTAYSQFGCRSSAYSETVVVGAVPVVKFDFAGMSTSDQITFRSKSTVGAFDAATSPVKKLYWNFGDGNTDDGTVNTEVKSHKYTNPGIYPVSLAIESTIGCLDTLYRKIIVVNKIEATDTNSGEEQFDSNGAGWQFWNLDSLKTNPVVSWKHGQPAGTVIQGTSSAWTTGATTAITGKYQPKERSALFTSVYDISGLARPMVSFNSFVQLEQSDGVVLEYSTDSLNLADPKKKWTALGSLDQTTNISTGVDWYNKGNLASKPGDQILGNYGWSEVIDPDRDNVQEWLESKHSLGNIVRHNDRLVFRFALSSVNDDPQLDGFALDNFRIGNRTRIVLLENFRNLGNAAIDTRGIIEKEEAEEISAFNPSGVATSVVRINYHVAFPAADPFNAENNQDPGSRALYYNISQTPRARMDGQSPADALFSTWGENFYNIRSLKLADAVITPTVTTHADGSGSVSVNVKALKELGPETILNVALVERSIDLARLSADSRAKVRTQENVFEYVLKKLVPNASGTRFGSVLAADNSRVFSQNLSWTKDFALYDPTGDLSLVIFLQNENTKEIYQSEIIPVNDPDVTTGIEDLNPSFNVYPNPADKEMRIELPENITDGAKLRMFDQVGKVVNEVNFEKGEHTSTLDTSILAAGVYLIQVETPKGILTRKVMVLHNR